MVSDLLAAAALGPFFLVYQGWLSPRVSGWAGQWVVASVVGGSVVGWVSGVWAAGSVVRIWHQGRVWTVGGVSGQ